MHTSGMLASVTTTLASKEQRNSGSPSSSTAGDSASAHHAGQLGSQPLAPTSPLLQELRPASSWLAITGLLQGRTPTLTLASPLQRELHLASGRRAWLPTNRPFQGQQYHRSDYYFISIISGVGLSPLGTAATSGLLYKPQMIDDECGAVGGIRIAGETEVLGENVPQCHFVPHKSHMTRPGLEPGPPRWEVWIGFINAFFYNQSLITINYSAIANLPTSQITRTRSILVLVLRYTPLYSHNYNCQLPNSILL
jgi:hypothetical protein